MDKVLADRIEAVVGSFDNRQERALNAILDSSLAEDGFVFPIIDGPPGTGKTTVGVAAALEYLKENPRGQVLYTCYTHFAAEQAKRIFEEKFLFPRRNVIKLQPGFYKSWDEGIIGCRSDLSDLSRNELRALKECPILLCTLYGSTRAKEARRAGSKMIVDEFSQIDPAIFFMTLNKIKIINPSSYALLGDPLQLPVVTTQSILRPNIGQYIRARKPHTPHQLILQHRMHSHICAGINAMRREAFFTYEMQTADDIKCRDMETLGYEWRKTEVDPKYRDILDPAYPFVIVNTDTLDGEEEQTESGSTKYTSEAKLAAKLAENAYRSYVKKNGDHLKEAMVLSPYNAQIYEISTLLNDPINDCCNTIYSSQGREFPFVIVSFVRKNPQGFIGFLEDLKLRAQVYVACSRAQAKLIVLLSRKTFIGRGHLIFEALYNTKEAFKEDAPA
jgi:DNA polymerase III delta prime subunit